MNTTEMQVITVNELRKLTKQWAHVATPWSEAQ